MSRIHPDLEELDMAYRKMLADERVSIAAHTEGELGLAAAAYAAPVPVYLMERDGDEEFRFIDPWPFSPEGDLRKTANSPGLTRDGKPGASLTAKSWRIRMLTLAAVFAMAEVRRLQVER